MTPQQVHDWGIVPGLALLPGKLTSPDVRVLLVAISGQEASWMFRQQSLGPAVGLWQCEPATVDLLAQHATAGQMLLSAAALLDIPSDSIAVAIQWNDTLAAVVARLLLYAEPTPLPQRGDADACWEYYQRVWRPGRPRQDRWVAAHHAAMHVVWP